MTKDIVVRPDASPASPEVDLDAIRAATAEEALELRNKASAYEVYARAKNLADAYQAAGEAKLWAERRIGELRKATRSKPGADPRGQQGVGEFDQSLGIDSWHARKWEVMAEIPEARFIEILAQIRKADGAYNASGVLDRDRRSYEYRVEHGIYQIRDGRLVLQWKREGTKHREVLGHRDLERARRDLAIRTGRVREKPPYVKTGTPESVYSLVRRALQTLDQVEGPRSLDAGHWLAQASHRLHEAEVALLRAINDSPAGMRG